MKTFLLISLAILIITKVADCENNTMLLAGNSLPKGKITDLGKMGNRDLLSSVLLPVDIQKYHACESGYPELSSIDASIFWKPVKDPEGEPMLTTLITQKTLQFIPKHKVQSLDLCILRSMHKFTYSMKNINSINIK